MSQETITMQDLMNEIAKLHLEISELKSLVSIRHREDSGSSASSANTQKIIFEKYKRGVRVSGNTKPHKDILKTIGGASWNPSLKSWIMKLDKTAKVITVIRSLDPDNVEVGDGILTTVESDDSE